MLLQLFFAVMGASGPNWRVLEKGPNLCVFVFVLVAVHLCLILVTGKLFGYSRRDVLLASSASIGGTIRFFGTPLSRQSLGWPVE